MFGPNACSRQRGRPFKAVRLPLKSDRLPFSQSVELDDQIADSALGDQLAWRMSSKCLKWGRQPFFLRRGDDVIIHPREQFAQVSCSLSYLAGSLTGLPILQGSRRHIQGFCQLALA